MSHKLLIVQLEEWAHCRLEDWAQCLFPQPVMSLFPQSVMSLVSWNTIPSAFKKSEFNVENSARKFNSCTLFNYFINRWRLTPYVYQKSFWMLATACHSAKKELYTRTYLHPITKAFNGTVKLRQNFPPIDLTLALTKVMCLEKWFPMLAVHLQSFNMVA